MRNYTEITYDPTEVDELRRLTTDLDFQLGKRVAWLQRLMLKGLEKLGARRQYSEYVMRVVRVQHDTLSELFARQLNHARERLMNRDRFELLIGRHEWHEIVNDPDCRHYFNFHVHGDGGRHHDFMGFRVRVIPWMKGVIVVPLE